MSALHPFRSTAVSSRKTAPSTPVIQALASTGMPLLLALAAAGLGGLHMPAGAAAADTAPSAASAAPARSRAGADEAHRATVRPAPRAASGSASGATARAVKPKVVAKPEKLVDINSASVAELMKLPGIGAAEADRIVAGRPYRTSAELATSKVVPEGVYIALRRSVVAMPPGGGSGPKPRATAPAAKPTVAASAPAKGARP